MKPWPAAPLLAPACGRVRTLPGGRRDEVPSVGHSPMAARP